MDMNDSPQNEQMGALRSTILFEYIRNRESTTIEIATEHYAIGYIFHGSCSVVTGACREDVTERCPYVLERGSHLIESKTDENNVFEQIVIHLNSSDQHSNCHIRIEDERLESVVLEAITKNVSLEELADRCYVSVSTFKRRFRKRFSISPHKWFLDRKLEIAYRIIINTDLPIVEVAQLCGFVNVSHFISAFKRKYSVTPASLRRREHLDGENR